MKYIWLIVLLNISLFTLNAQLPAAQDAPTAEYDKGKILFEQAIYQKSIFAFTEFLSQTQNISQADYSHYRKEADYYIALASIKLNLPEAEVRILKFVNTYKPDPFAEKALIDVAGYYFDQRDYDKAYDYYDKVDINNVSQEQRSEVLFKKGYVLFDKNQYGKARSYFEPIQNVKNEHYLPTNYYLAMCHYYQGNYEAAIPYLEKVSESRRYNRFIPSYLAQIYYQMGQYEKIIDYAPEKLDDSHVQEKDQIAYVLGLSYLQEENYEKALPLLEQYGRSNTLSTEDHYQIAYCRYKIGDYDGAIQGFKKVSDENNKMGQNANLFLAHSFIKLDDKGSARNAFANAARREADKEIAEEARFNYGKLSAEMGFDREAVNALTQISADSEYYQESQTILSDLFLNTRDYDKAISTIESFSPMTPELKKAYQQVTYLKAVQLIQDESLTSALNHLEKSLSASVDPYYTTLATFWKGDIQYRKMNYTASAVTLNSYLTLAKSAGRLPSSASPYMAQYTQGYNYLKRNQHQTAERYFSEAATDIQRNRVNIDNAYIEENIYSDALLRLGDCLFKRNAYEQALDRYNEVIQKRASGFVYALFQKAIILGLQQKRYDKIIALEDLVKSYPQSAYADDALLELGITYIEMGKLNDAVQPLSRLVNDFRESSDLVVDGLLRLGLISYNLGDVKAALNHYKAVFDFNPTREQAQEALDGIEEIYVQDLGDPQGYVEFLEQTRGTEVKASEKEQISYRAAESQFENGNYQAAAKAYGNYVREFPKGAHVLAAYFRKGESHLAQKEYSPALEAYKEVIQRGPSPYYAPAVEKAAVIAYNHENDFEKATEYYLRWSKVATSEEDRFNAQLGGLESAYRAGMEKEVKELANKVYEHPNASPENKATALFYKGKAAYDEGQYNQALNAFNEVTRLSDNENTAEARYLIAEIYYKQNEFELAEKLCEQSYKESSNYPYWVAKSLILLADIYSAQGNNFNAKAALETVIENFKQDPEILAIAKEKLEEIKARENE